MKFEIDIGWFSGCHPCLENFALDGGDDAVFDKDKNDIREEPEPTTAKVQAEEEAVQYEYEDNTILAQNQKRKSRLLPWKGGRSKKTGKGDDASTGSNKSSAGSILKSFKGRSTKGKSYTEAIDSITIVDMRDDELVVCRLDGIESKDLTSDPSKDDDMRVMQDVEILVKQLTSPMPDTKNGCIKEQTGNSDKLTIKSNRTKDHKDDGSRSSGGNSRSSKSRKMSWRRKASNNKRNDSAQPQPILYDYYKIIGGVSDVMVRLPYNRSLTFTELRREIEIDFAEEMPLSEYKFLMNADGVAVGRSQEQKWLVRDYDMVDLTMGGDGTGLNPYLVYISRA